MALIISTRAVADVPSALEPAYSEAVLAYNGKDYKKAVDLLDPLIKKEPKIVEFIELKALSLKMMKDPVRAIETYENLIAAKAAVSRPESETAPYHFELGQLYFEKNDLVRSKDHFKTALKASFNVAASHFFLGLANFKAKEWEQSESEFRNVLRGDVDELKPSAHFYLGQVALQTGYASGATQSFYAARGAAKDQVDGKETPAETRKAAQQVYDSANASLRPFSTPKLFGNVSLISAYDTNVLSVPSSQASTGTGTGQASLKETFQAGLGYMTSPLNSWQLVPSAQASYNHCFNSDVRSGQFLTGSGSFYMTRNALAATSWGHKLQGIYTFQNQVDPETDKGTLKPYSLTASVGPYFRKEIARKLVFGAEAYAQPGKNFLDSTVTDDTYKRSGFELTSKVYLRNDKGSGWVNPGASIGLGINDTSGEEYRSQAILLGVSNLVHLTETATLALTADYTPTSYNKRKTGERSDKNLSLDANLSLKLADKYSLLGDLQYISNDSNIPDLFKYTRLVVSAGLGYSL